MMRRVHGPRREVDEKRFVRCKSLLELHPGNGLVSHIGHEVVTRIVRRFDASETVVETRRPLVSLAAHETIELVEARTRRPTVSRSGGTNFPRRRFVILTEEACA